MRPSTWIYRFYGLSENGQNFRVSTRYIYIAAHMAHGRMAHARMVHSSTLYPRISLYSYQSVIFIFDSRLLAIELSDIRANYLTMSKMIECPICFLKYTASKKAPTSLLCGHTLCVECAVRIVTETALAKTAQRMPRDQDLGPYLTSPNELETQLSQHKEFTKLQELYRLECPICKDITMFNAKIANFLMTEMLALLKLGEDPLVEDEKIPVKIHGKKSAVKGHDPDMRDILDPCVYPSSYRNGPEFQEDDYIRMINDPDYEHFGY